MVLQATRTLLLKNILCSQRFFKKFGLETHGRTLGHSGQYSRKLMIELQDIQDSTPGNLSNYFRKLRIVLQETKDSTPGNYGKNSRKLRIVLQETQVSIPGNSGQNSRKRAADQRRDRRPWTKTGFYRCRLHLFSPPVGLLLHHIQPSLISFHKILLCL